MHRPWQAVETKTCWTGKTLNVLWHQKVKSLISDFSFAWKKLHHANPNLCSGREPGLPLFITTGVDVEVNTVMPFISCIIRIQIQFLFEIKFSRYSHTMPYSVVPGCLHPLTLVLKRDIEHKIKPLFFPLVVCFILQTIAIQHAKVTAIVNRVYWTFCSSWRFFFFILLSTDILSCSTKLWIYKF